MLAKFSGEPKLKMPQDLSFLGSQLQLGSSVATQVSLPGRDDTIIPRAHINWDHVRGYYGLQSCDYWSRGSQASDMGGVVCETSHIDGVVQPHRFLQLNKAVLLYIRRSFHCS